MDLRHLFLRYSFAVNFILLFVLAYLGAGAVNQVLASRVRKDLAKPVVVNVAADATPTFSADAGAISTRDLFRVGPPPAEPTDGGSVDPSAPSQTQLRLKLLGVLFYGEQSQRNVATIQNLTDQKANVYVPGGKVQEGVTLAEVQVDRVILDRGNGVLEELLFDQTGMPGLPSAPPPGPRPGPPRDDTAGLVQQVSDTEFVVQRSAIDSALNNMSTLMTQARIIPNFAGQGEERKVDGFRIFRIKPESVFKALGLNDGDVIKSINGEQMDSLEKGLGMLKGLSGMTQFSIQIERQREPRTHNYRVQ